MSKATCCLFALGLSVSLAVACGDDDGDETNVGGTGGRGGTGGSAGTAGRGGTGGTAGAAGTAGGGSGGGGTGGSAGSAGAAGTAGAAGAAGAAGTGGSGGDEPDAGPDADVTDAGLTCPGDTTGATSSADNQEIIITALVFGEDSVEVTFRAVAPGGFDFGDPLLLCTGSEPEDCDEEVQGLPTLAVGQEASITTGLGLVTAASGEIALVNGLPTAPDAGNPEPIVRAYVNWGGFVSSPPDNGAVDDLETRADTEGVWTAEESIDVGDDTVIFATGDVTSADGFATCSPD